MEENKCSYNILRTLKNTPHFNAMSSTISVALNVLTTMSVRNSLRLAAYSQAKTTKGGMERDEFSGEEYYSYTETGDASSKKDLQVVDTHINNFLIST